jgi:hypothetical protein
VSPQERLTAALGRIPYAGFLGVRAELKGDELTLILPYSEHLVGNPLLPALHGGETLREGWRKSLFVQ